MIVLLTALIVCMTVLGVVWLLRPSPSPVPQLAPSVLDERLLEYVIVTLKTGSTFGGVLYVEDHGAVVLAKAEHVGRNGDKTPADGEIIVLRGDIDYIQRP